MNSKDTLSYIADITRELEAMASEAGHPHIAFLLRLVRSKCGAEAGEPGQDIGQDIEEDTSGPLN